MNSSALPDGWRLMAIGEIHAGDITSLSPIRFPDEQFEYFSIPAYQNGEAPQISKGSDILSPKLIIPPQCVLFGKLNPRVQKVWNVRSRSSSRHVASTEWLPIVPQERIDQDFIYYLMWSDWVMPVAQGLVSGSTPSRQRVESKAFYDIEVPVPEFEEQQKIAKVLRLFQKTSRREADSVRSLHKLKRAAMQALFRRGLRDEPQKETEIGTVPETWAVTPLASVATVKGGKRMPKGIALTREDTGRPYIRVTDFRDHGVNTNQVLFVPKGYESTISRYIISKDDVYISIAGTIGLVGQVPQVLDGANLTENAAKISLIDQSTNTRFLMYALASDTCQSQIAQSTATNAQPKLALVRIEQIQLPIPPTLDEQHKIVGIFDAIDRKIELHCRKRAVLEALFKALLHKLMTGEVGVGELGVLDGMDQICQDRHGSRLTGGING